MEARSKKSKPKSAAKKGVRKVRKTGTKSMTKPLHPTWPGTKEVI